MRRFIIERKLIEIKKFYFSFLLSDENEEENIKLGPSDLE